MLFLKNKPPLRVPTLRGGLLPACAPGRYSMPPSWTFQSTLPVGGATTLPLTAWTTLIDFNPRSPWGERQNPGQNFRRGGAISIHAPRGGSDQPRFTVFPSPCTFQSTLPVGGATGRTERPAQKPGDFNPRSPWGERRPFPTKKEERT